MSFCLRPLEVSHLRTLEWRLRQVLPQAFLFTTPITQNLIHITVRIILSIVYVDKFGWFSSNQQWIRAILDNSICDSIESRLLMGCLISNGISQSLNSRISNNIDWRRVGQENWYIPAYGADDSFCIIFECIMFSNSYQNALDSYTARLIRVN